MKKILIWLVVLAAVGAGGWLGWKSWKKNGAESSAPAVPTAAVERRTIEMEVRIAGDLEPVDVLEVKSEVSAKIKKLHVELGQKVPQGALLVELDDKELLTEKASIQIEIEGAQLELDKAVKDFERNNNLFQRQLIAQKDLDDARTAKELAENRLDRASKRMQVLDDRLAKTKISAPMGGVILELPVVEGQVVVAAASVNSGTLIMKLANTTQLLIRTHVNQVDVARLREKMPVTFTVDSIPGVKMEGKVFRIAPTATVRNNIKGFQVEIRIDSPDARIRPGMTADVVVPVDRVENALAVPLPAVFLEPDGSKVVFVAAASPEAPAEKRAVEAGLSDVDFVEIRSGVAQGESVLLVRPAGRPAAAR